MYNSHLFAFACTISNIYEQFISSDADYLNGKFALLIYVCTTVVLMFSVDKKEVLGKLFPI